MRHGVVPGGVPASSSSADNVRYVALYGVLSLNGTVAPAPRIMIVYSTLHIRNVEYTTSAWFRRGGGQTATERQRPTLLDAATALMAQGASNARPTVV